ncbi:MAG TPA: hypothetical protein VFN67_22875 [Polyangiales bacterium]|nr:hypothetical protein [Polyangiales bacterium]
MRKLFSFISAYVLPLAAATSLSSCGAAQRVPASSSVSAGAKERSLDGPGFSLRLSLAPTPNLLFQLDCVSETVLCAPDGYKALWKELGLDADDEAALIRWRTLRKRHEGVALADATLASAPLLVTGAYVDVAERQRIAGLRARTTSGFEASIALLSNDADAAELRRIAERFEPRFLRFWQRSYAGMSRYFDEMAKLLGDPFLLKTFERVLRFYEHAADGGETYRINLIAQPLTSNPGTTAYQLESDFLIETPERGHAAQMIDVLMHELCHALLFQMPTAAKLRLVQGFIASDDPFALVDYGLFDEALATSFGNGLVFRHYWPDRDFAEHSARGFRSQYKSAGALAAAFLPRFEALLASDVTVTSPEVVRALSEAARASYRAQGPSPIDYLHSHVLVAAPPLKAAAEHVRDAAFAGFPYLREFRALDVDAQRYLAARPQLNAALYLPLDADLFAALAPLDVAAARIAELRSAAARKTGLVYTLRRTNSSYLFVFMATDGESANGLADAFIALREMREGALIEQPR